MQMVSSDLREEVDPIFGCMLKCTRWSNNNRVTLKQAPKESDSRSPEALKHMYLWSFGNCAVCWLHSQILLKRNVETAAQPLVNYFRPPVNLHSLSRRSNVATAWLCLQLDMRTLLACKWMFGPGKWIVTCNRTNFPGRINEL